jgi:hypothetical protein
MQNMDNRLQALPNGEAAILLCHTISLIEKSLPKTIQFRFFPEPARQQYQGHPIRRPIADWSFTTTLPLG